MTLKNEGPLESKITPKTGLKGSNLDLRGDIWTKFSREIFFPINSLILAKFMYLGLKTYTSYSKSIDFYVKDRILIQYFYTP